MTFNPPSESRFAAASRFMTAQTWWIASELVRRHPHLLMTRVTAEDDGPVVLLHDEQDGMRIQFDLERGIRFVVLGEAVNMGWRRIVNSDSSHEIVKMIEFATGLQAPRVTPNTTHRALVYRLISSFLTSVVNDPNEWNVVPATMSTDGTNDQSAGQFLLLFPSTRAAVAAYTAQTHTQVVRCQRPRPACWENSSPDHSSLPLTAASLSASRPLHAKGPSHPPTVLGGHYLVVRVLVHVWGDRVNR
ncbi:hypothetical protein E3O11_15915 [Cryobacterium levicorallinum]|uniref:T3SS peptide-binding chaperone domain-containing protein n=2 Tax=Cryobacterium levicorallinum TaxID=995038 RepID=A0A4R8VFY5_9MICO|nr:hypothetical protein [Cryobacterium levicorallinum]TFB81913.1 hypothetical protein E3O11_15915 [Cryobacterium levicorallinum]